MLIGGSGLPYKSLYVHDPNIEWLHSLKGNMYIDPGQLSGCH